MASPLLLVGLVVAGGLLLAGGASGATPSKPPDKPPSKPPGKDASAARGLLVEAARSFLGTPYQWGGGRNPKTDYGLDCSGLVIASARKAGLPLPPATLATSNGWWQALERVEVPLPGDLSLYGAPSRATHVELVTSFDPSTGLAQTIGANGGDSTTTTPERAAEKHAFVKESTSESKRFLGFCRYPLERLLSPQNAGLAIEGGPSIWSLQHDEA